MKRKRHIYIASSELGEVRFYKIERLRDFLWQFFPKWLHKIRVYKKLPNGLLIEGKFIDDKKVVVF